ncbi:hypothetical protein D9M68_530020 [compost metagenome]
MTYQAGTDIDHVDVVMNFSDPTQKLAVMDDAVKANASIRLIPHEVRIHNARNINATLEGNAFTLGRIDSSVKNFFDVEQVRSVYFSEVAELIKEKTGAEYVKVFGEQVRGAAEGGQTNARTPAMNTHVDYDIPTAHAIAQLYAPEEHKARYLSGRWMIINVWRPLKTIERNPLAVVDGSTVTRNDQHLCKLLATRSGVSPAFGFNISYSDEQRWYFYPAMTPEEVLVFKMVDSDAEAVQWAAHSSFNDPHTSPDAPARESIEVRTIAYIP